MSYADAHACSTARETAGRSLGSGLEREALRAALVRLEVAERRAVPYELSAALAGVGRCYRRLMALRTAEDSLQQALRWARMVGSPDLEVDLLCELAECACLLAEQLGEEEFRGSHAARERCRDAAFEASVRVRRVADPQWECTTLLRISDVLSRCGDHDDAASLQNRAMGMMSSGGTTHE
jgi:tetratricopeptide (TPR) repeat protein